MKLELKHLSNYLPYNIDVYRLAEVDNPNTVKLTPSVLMLWLDDYYDEFKPILRPVSDLQKQITHNGKTFIPLEELTKLIDLNTEAYELRFENRLFVLYNKKKEHYMIQDNNFFLCEQLDKWGIDWRYDLIDNNLAIDLNTVSNESIH